MPPTLEIDCVDFCKALADETRQAILQLLIEGEKGSLLNESQWSEPPLWFYPQGKKEKVDLTQKIKGASIPEQYNKSDEHILKNFYRAITRNERPICSADDGLQSVAAIEASRLACEAGKTVFLDQVPCWK